MTINHENILSAAEMQAIIITSSERGATHGDLARDVEQAVMAKLRNHDVEGLIEQAYQEFADMRHGLGKFAGEPWPEREAFKAHMRRFAYARYHELIGDVLREIRDKGTF
ncbi:hypothetical protein [Eoetvoesiella caeni]